MPRSASTKFNISKAETEHVIQPDSMADDLGWETGGDSAGPGWRGPSRQSRWSSTGRPNPVTVTMPSCEFVPFSPRVDGSYSAAQTPGKWSSHGFVRRPPPHLATTSVVKELAMTHATTTSRCTTHTSRPTVKSMEDEVVMPTAKPKAVELMVVIHGK